MTHTPNTSRLNGRWVAVAGIAAQLAVSIWLALKSNGTYQDDELRHYLVARTAAHHWHKLLDVWGRPGFTIPFALPAAIGNVATGFTATRLMTVVVMTLASWLTYLTARRMQAPLACLTPWLLLLMPLWTGLTFTPTTEAVAALYLIAGTWQLACGRHRGAAICFALLPLSRHELIVLLVPVAVYFLWRRDVIAVLLLGCAEAAWNALAWLAGLGLPAARFFSPLEQGHLGSGNVLHYFNRWMEMGGVAGVGLTLAGAAIIARRDLRPRRLLDTSAAARRARLRFMVAGGAVGLVALQTVLYHFNRFASGGYARFLVPTAPWMAVTILYALKPLLQKSRVPSPALLIVALVLLASVYSGSWITTSDAWRLAAAGAVVVAMVYRQRCVATVAAALLVWVNGMQWRHDVHPNVILPHQRVVGDTIAELKAKYPGRKIVGASPWVKYFLGESMVEEEPQAKARWAADDPRGVLYLYDGSHATAVPFEWFAAFPHAVVMERGDVGETGTRYVRVLERVEK